MACACAGLTANLAEAADPQCPYGVNAHQASNAALDLVAAAGIAWVRFDLNWLQFEPDQGNFQWNEADRFVEHAASLGLSVYMTAAYTPMWAVGVPCNDADPNDANWCHNAPPASSSSWTSFVTAAVTRYGDKVKAWGMWNEPNLKSFYRGTRDQYVNDILVPGSAAVHAACPDCKVMGPELANLRGADWDKDEGECYGTLGCRYNAWEYSLTKILAAAGGSIDVITHHKYRDPATAMWKELTDGVNEGPIEVNHGLKVILDAAAPGKPVWITEFGWESEPFGDKTNIYAAQQLTEAYQGFIALRNGTQPSVTNQPWPNLEKLFWYDLHDDPNGYSWGLLDSSLGKKAPYDAYAAVITALGPCGSGGSAGEGGAAGAGGSGGGAGGSGGTVGQGGKGGAGGSLPGDAAAGTGGVPADGSAQGGASSQPPSQTSGSDSGCGCRTAQRQEAGAWIGALLAAALCAYGRKRKPCE